MATLEKGDIEQVKYNDVYPSENTLVWSKKYLYEIWPELEQHDSSIKVIYAGLGYPQFHLRKVESVIEEIKHEYSLGKRNFLFQCLDEGLSISNVLLLQKVCNNLDIINDISIIYATGALDGNKVYSEWCEQNNVINKHIKIISGSNFEKNCKRFLYFTKDYQVGLKPKKFLCFNKEDRNHRIVMFEQLLRLNLVENSYYSFSVQPHVLESLLKTDPEGRYNNIVSIADKLPLVLNRSTERPNPADVRDDDLIYFENSYFSIVNETLFYGLKRDPNKHYINIPDIYGNFFSEKIFKCLALNHPFIVGSTHNFLKHLHDRGYKTFHPYIDETYDTIEDDHLRMDMIIKEINRLCSLSDEELIEFTKNIKPIVEYNSNYYAKVENYRVTENVVSLLK